MRHLKLCISTESDFILDRSKQVKFVRKEECFSTWPADRTEWKTLIYVKWGAAMPFSVLILYPPPRLHFPSVFSCMDNAVLLLERSRGIVKSHGVACRNVMRGEMVFLRPVLSSFLIGLRGILLVPLNHR